MRWRAGIALGLAALGAPLAAPATAERVALVCVWPERYDNCIDKCAWKQRQYEEDGCRIVLQAPEISTCRDVEVRAVLSCRTRCKAEYCPHYR